MIASLGRYEIVSELGRGAMGVVYKARDPLLERTVAIKTILMSPDAADLADYEARFHQEAKAAAGLNHPGIVTIHDIGRVDDVVYMAMEYVEGHELRDALAGGGRLPVAQAIDVAAQLADALAYAHAQGIVHRDIKPANVMLMRDGRAKIMDFGIARRRVSNVKTQTGVLLGSPRYMSPEQVQGRPADARSDLFALGVVLYEMLAGAPPFGGDDVTALIYSVAHTEPPPPSAVNREVSTMLDLVVARALAKDPAARYAAADTLAADLRASLAAFRDGATKLRGAPAPPERTLPLDRTAPVEGTQPLHAAGTVRARGLAQAFDSSAALARLAAGGSLHGTAGRARGGRRRSPPLPYTAAERLVLAASLIILAAAAALIALR